MFGAPVQLYKNAYSGIPPAVWRLAVVMFVNRCGTMVIPFLTVYLTTTKGFSLQQAGYVMAAFGCGSIGGSYLGGRLSDRFGPYRVQSTSLALNGLLFVLLGQMQRLPLFIACIFVLGIVGEAFRPANSVAVANASTDESRIRCYALNRLAINLGWSIGPAVGGLLAGINYGLLFWVDGLTCVAAAGLLLAVAPQQPQRTTPRLEPHRATGPTAYRDTVFLRGMFYLLLVALAFFQLFSVLPAYFKTQLRFREATIGGLLAMNGLLIALFEMVLVYKLERRNRGSVYLFTGALLMGLSFLLLGAGKATVVAVASMVLITVGEMFLFPFLNHFWVQRSEVHNRGQYAAVYTMVWAAASVLAPTLGTQVAARAGFGWLWVLNFALCGLGAAGFYFLKKEMQ